MYISYYIGPITFTLGDYNGSLPTLKDNPRAWTQSLNIIYMDGPVGAGLSYLESLDGYYLDDYEFAAQTHEFLRKWLELHPQFLESKIYIGGDSYSGIPIPMIVQNIVIANEAERLPLINLNALYESAKNSCNSNYVNIDVSNYQCASDVAAIDALTSDINLVQILEPYCSNAIPEPNEDVESVQRFLTKVSSPTATHWCRSYNHMLCYVWANQKSVQEALGVRPGTKHFWQYCNTTLAYTKSVTNVVSYHRNLTNADLRLLVYSGDHDMSIPHIGTQQWISSLGLSTDESWRVWSLDGQTTGYTKKLISSTFTLNYVTVKGAGHFAAEYMVKECAAMIDRWLAYFPI
ncbi:hypothetical protein CMV_030643 [Castanea mollissima]|uniref:Serine carboxypeptidase-like 18 n=1 Tax=Castanea mollissima TaxID=60419 RepID=A0A8J4Q5U8_9ROSI|nr:hypothetical protein CMV_030643 [Castanea mollissima]